MKWGKWMRSSRKKVVVAITMLVVMVGIAVAVVWSRQAWRPAPPDHPLQSGQHVPKQESPFTDEEIARLNDAVQAAGSEPVALAAARPGYRTDEQGKRRIVTIHDVDESHKAAGMYQLQVFCLGTGSLDIDFSVGDASRNDALRCIADDIAVANMPLEATDSDIMEITIRPSEASDCQIAYRVDRIPSA